jgi:hypothetical protein
MTGGIDGRAIRRAMLVRAGTLGISDWSMLLAVTIGTNLLDFAAVAPPGGRSGPMFLLAAALRVVLVFWIIYVLLRRLTGTARPFRIDSGFWRLALLQLGLLIFAGLATRLGLILMGPHPTLAGQWLGALIGMALAGLLTIRLAAYHTALAVGAPFAALGPLWRNQKDATTGLVIAFVVLVLPIAALHLALTLVGLRIPMQPVPHTLLVVADGVVQAWQLILTLALATVAWRIAGSPARAG